MNRIFRNLDDYEVIYPQVVGADVSDDIVFTKRAMDAIIRELYDNYSFFDDTRNEMIYFIRLNLESTPTFAKKISIRFDNKLDKFDRVFELRKIRIVIDRRSIFYFMGVLIDYIKTDKSEGFIFFETHSDDIDTVLEAL